jgi:transcriptional regulator with XRE-family HTH domain
MTLCDRYGCRRNCGLKQRDGDSLFTTEVKELAHARNLTAARLASALGLEQIQLSRELAFPRASHQTAERFAQALGLPDSSSYLFSCLNDAYPQNQDDLCVADTAISNWVRKPRTILDLDSECRILNLGTTVARGFINSSKSIRERLVLRDISRHAMRQTIYKKIGAKSKTPDPCDFINTCLLQHGLAWRVNRLDADPGLFVAGNDVLAYVWQAVYGMSDGATADSVAQDLRASLEGHSLYTHAMDRHLQKMKLDTDAGRRFLRKRLNAKKTQR